MDAISITETREPSLANRLGGRHAIVLRDKRFLVCVMAFVGILLSSCARYTQEQCLNPDWSGYEDGSNGKAVDQISLYRKTCAKEYGLVPNLDPYQTGRQRGLEQVY